MYVEKKNDIIIMMMMMMVMVMVMVMIIHTFSKANPQMIPIRINILFSDFRLFK